MHKVTWGYLDSEVTLTADGNIAMADITLISTTPKHIVVNCYCFSLFLNNAKLELPNITLIFYFYVFRVIN